MANKYIRHGETFNGDGTTSAAATSNGGVGAWNNINILEGTTPAFGSLASGDVVFIRSKSAAGANLAFTLAASKNLGSSVGTPALPVTWILDSGNVWSGINGTLTYSCGSTYTITFVADNRFRCETPQSWAIVETNTAASAKTYGSTGNVEYDGLLLDFSAPTSSFGCVMTSFAAACQTYRACLVKIGKNSGGVAFFGASYYSTIRFIGTNIELTQLDNSQALLGGTSDLRIEIIGGSISGVGATTGKVIVNSLKDAQHVFMLGLKYPKTMTLCGAYASTYGNCEIVVAASDGAAGGAIFNSGGFAESRLDQYYSTLNARLPNSTSIPWSWFVYPSRASKTFPMRVTSNLLFTGAAAAKVITLQLLVANTFSGVNKSNLYALVTYIDNSTGLSKCVTTQVAAGDALTTSTAAWSASSYGSTGFDKRSLSLTTPTAIKQDTLISVALYCELASSSAGDTIIMDPDFSVA